MWLTKMKTYSNRDEIYVGRYAGKELLQDIKLAKEEIKIVSPYLTPSYIEELIKLQKKGVKVTLIASDNIPEGDGVYSQFNHKNLIRQARDTNEMAKEKRGMGMFLSGASFFASLILLVFSGIALILGIISVGFFFYYYNLRIYSYDYYPIFNLRVFFSQYARGVENKGTHVIHSKLYVIDKKTAYVGSVNFTHSGIQNNYECIVKVKEPNAVRRISGEIDSLFNSKDRYFKSIREWGKELYEEPAN